MRSGTTTAKNDSRERLYVSDTCCDERFAYIFSRMVVSDEFDKDDCDR